MKKIYSLIIVVLIFIGCTDEIGRLPLDALVEQTTFTSNENFKTFSWGFYETFPGYLHSVVDRDYHSDLISDSRNGRLGSDWLYGRITIPTNTDNWSDPYETIRRVNIMLANIEGSPLSEVDQNHWKSVGLFFRSLAYFDLLKKYGSVPWVETVVNDTDTEILEGPRNSRDDVAANILRDLKIAEANIKETGDGPNTINTDVVRAFISRFGLFEGTWRKYHGLGGENEYLEASVQASEEVIANHTLHSNYDEVFNSLNLANVSGILLYKQYELGILQHALTTWMRNSSGRWDLTKKAADMFLYTDGTPVGAKANFSEMEKDAYNEFRDRDRRMYFITVPPYKINTIPPGKNTSNWEFTSDPKEREYIDLMATLTNDNFHALPDLNWRGFVVRNSPHFRSNNNGHGYNVTQTGYKLFKFFDRHNLGAPIHGADITDAPIFRLGEVLLNYAEAQFELGAINQTIIDLTVNPLRARGQVVPLDISNIVSDPRRDPSVDPVLWEIRRERAIELFAEAYRFDDLKRWKKMDDYAAKQQFGRWIIAADENNKVPVFNGAAEGYISVFPAPPAWPDYYYLYPIPSNQIVLNPQLEQNPGWDSL